MKIKYILLLILPFMLSVSCSEWTEPRPVEFPGVHPWEKDPDAWAEYTAALREYRTTPHNIIYVRLKNSPESFSSEKYSLRCIADSVDIVSLANSQNISQNDVADLPLMKEKGIRVLYQFDYASRSGEFADMAALEAALDEAIAAVARYGLDGWSFTGIYKWGDKVSQDAAALIFDKLNSAKDATQLLVFEGNPQFVTEKDRRKLDYTVLDTEGIQRTGTIATMASSAVGSGILAKKLLLTASVGTFILDNDMKEADAVGQMAEFLLSSGQYAGLAVYDVEDDYYSPDGNYLQLRAAIQMLNR